MLSNLQMTVCLAMIVRDEEAVIRRCLTSTRGLIDRHCIVDTGSNDATLEEIERHTNSPGEVHRRAWRSFGDNLTEALALARGKADWVLRLDADMEIEYLHPAMTDWLANDPDPTTDAWQVEVVEHWGSYRLPLLVRGSLDWRYEGVTHEYLAPARKQRALLGLTVRHHADGSARQEKFERDRGLLEAELARDPENARTIFYLAQTYRDLGDTDRAIELYQTRASMNGWEEESWYAEYQAAKLSDDLDALLAVHTRRPWRHEPLKAAAALVSRDSKDDVLFLEAA
jgi:glycosyltransferase involved in cell wall biosynthesis